MIDPTSLDPDDYLFPVPEVKSDDVLVIITQSCDILNDRSESEPTIEVLIARRAKKVHGRFSQGKHPRRYGVSCICGGNHCFEIAVRDRNFIKRSSLDKCRAVDCRLSTRATRNLAFWHGRRYFRSAFPTAFDKRITEERRDALLALLEGTHELITGIFFHLNTRDELPNQKQYRAKIYLVVHPDDWQDVNTRKDVVDFATAFEPLISCEGIIVDECEAVPSDRLDLYTVSNCLAFDQFDFLSSPAEGESPNPQSVAAPQRTIEKEQGHE